MYTAACRLNPSSSALNGFWGLKVGREARCETAVLRVGIFEWLPDFALGFGLATQLPGDAV